MIPSGNILVVGLILAFAIIVWYTHKSLNSTFASLEDELYNKKEEQEREDENTFTTIVDENSVLEVNEALDSDFIQYAQQRVDSKESKTNPPSSSKKLSEILKNVRPVVNLEIEPSVKQKNIRVNKKIKEE
jgi:hypothetical protein